MRTIAVAATLAFCILSLGASPSQPAQPVTANPTENPLRAIKGQFEAVMRVRQILDGSRLSRYVMPTDAMLGQIPAFQDHLAFSDAQRRQIDAARAEIRPQMTAALAELSRQQEALFPRLWHTAWGARSIEEWARAYINDPVHGEMIEVGSKIDDIRTEWDERYRQALRGIMTDDQKIEFHRATAGQR